MLSDRDLALAWDRMTAGVAQVHSAADLLRSEIRELREECARLSENNNRYEQTILNLREMLRRAAEEKAALNRRLLPAPSLQLPANAPEPQG